MATETISQILIPNEAPYVNGVQASVNFHKANIENLFQGLIEKNNRGVNSKLVFDDLAAETAQVFVNRILPIKMKPRELGSNKNGASFSSNDHYTQTQTVSIDLLQVVDDPIIIPRATQEMIRSDLLVENVKIFSDRLATIINGANFASKLLKVYEDKAAGKEVYETAIGSGDNVLTQFITANSYLDEGDEANGVDIFPEDTRIAVFRSNYRATLKTSGILVLGGANAAYDIAMKGGVTGGATKLENGYVGDIDGVPCHIISNESLSNAAGFLGMPDAELKRGKVIGYVASGFANALGVSSTQVTKVVDAIAGQGVVLQPYVKFGVASWYAKGTSMLTTGEYSLIGDLKSVFSSVASDITFRLKGAGSRLFPTLGVSATAAAVTATSEAKDDWGSEHLKGIAYVVADKAFATVAEFLDAYKADGAVKGTGLVSGTPSSFSASQDSGKVVNVLAIADDGSCSLGSATIA